MERQGLKWTKSETLLILPLYCKLSFGQFHQNNPWIIALAGKLKRSPSAVAMKLCNFASLDPGLKGKGLGNVSKQDREVWNEFFSGSREADIAEKEIESLEPDNWSAEDSVALLKTRMKQSVFRKNFLINYRSRCCISGIDCEDLLVASHIYPWAESKDERLNPSNGLCLNALHDRAFDRGLLTLDDDFCVVLSPLIKGKQFDFLEKFIGKQICMPERAAPSQEFLKYHREHIFKV